ncbi:hypothetical protein GCM10010341_28560 [Streptomyces noursei]|nr:hypothetical protein GCM10010341_28560 [Streptomyces noursei]
MRGTIQPSSRAPSPDQLDGKPWSMTVNRRGREGPEGDFVTGHESAGSLAAPGIPSGLMGGEAGTSDDQRKELRDLVSALGTDIRDRHYRPAYDSREHLLRGL